MDGTDGTIGARHRGAATLALRAGLPCALLFAAGAGAAGAATAGSPPGSHARLAGALSVPPPAVQNPSWSGEMARASDNGAAAFDHVTGAWVQPAVAVSSSPEYADTWVGVSGHGGSLLQAGTTAQAGGGSASYDAWFVAWNGAPSGMTVIDEPVSPGDHMQVAITRDATGAWTVVLGDTTAGWTWSTTVAYAAGGSTAEWIEEAPGTWSTPSRHQTLADYGSVTFTTVRADGAAPAAVTAFETVQDGAVVSYPSTYSTSHASFALHYGAPVPRVTAVSPSSGPVSGGSTVELTGSDLAGAPAVRFGGIAATVVRSSTTSLVVRTPPHAPGEVAVTVGAAPGGTASSGKGPALPAPGASFTYASEPGYVVSLASGGLDALGSAHLPAGGVPTAAGGVVALARDPATGGYWEATSKGGVYDVGAPDLGTLTALVQRLPIGSVASVTAAPTGQGYWLATTGGGVYAFGSARSFGTLRGTHLNRPIVGMAAAPTGNGYWLVASDGGIFAFGAARFYGSTGGIHLNAPIVGMTAAPTGHGYWLVASDGGIFTFGSARFFGSTGGIHLNAPIVGMTAAPTGHGYWLAAADGGIFAFGAAPFLGSAVTTARTSRAVGITAS